MSTMAGTKTQKSNKKNASKNDKKAKQPPATKSNGGLGEYLKGVKSEWHKVTWPTAIQVWQQTIVVLVMCALITFGLWFADVTFNRAINCVLVPDASEKPFDLCLREGK